MSAKQLLIIDDDRDVGTFLSNVAEKLGYEGIAVDNPEAFWCHLDLFDPVVIFVDLKMPNVDGIELLRKLATRNTKSHVVMMSGTDQRVLHTALRLGNDRGLRMLGTLQKPIRIRDIQEILQQASLSGPLHEADLRHGIEQKQIVVHYQPKVGLTPNGMGTISACEALVRWDHPERGIVMPDEFIPLAEKTGLIADLTELVVNETLRQLAAWRGEGLVLSVAVNISPLLLRDLDLPDVYYDLCKSKDVDTSQITLELTESGAMGDAALSMDILSRLRLKGFGLALDDFGTGYSSLVQLHRMPFNEMKIDKSFVMESDRNTEAVKIIHSIAGLAKSLQLNLCAEGVETLTALKLVREVGCHSAQGYLISKARRAEAIPEFVRNWKRDTTVPLEDLSNKC